MKTEYLEHYFKYYWKSEVFWGFFRVSASTSPIVIARSALLRSWAGLNVRGD
jgi:hypothetical protein